MSASALKHATKPFVILARLFAKSPDKVRLVRLEAYRLGLSQYLTISVQELEMIKPVAEHEFSQNACGSYVFLEPLQGDKRIITVFEG
jgi:hypothetical protein